MKLDTTFTGVRLHFKEGELAAITYEGKLLKVNEMNEKDRDEFYEVDQVKA